MSGSYARTAAQRSNDHLNSKVFEAEVRKHLPEKGLDDRTESVNDFDFFWRPDGLKEGRAWFLDVKEKNQPLTKRWHLLPNVPEENLFILDELAFRKGYELERRYNATSFYLIRDVPNERLFLGSVADLALIDRVRVDRKGPTGILKGKWIIDLGHLRQLELTPDLGELLTDLASDPLAGWIYSGCLSEKDVPCV